MHKSIFQHISEAHVERRASSGSTFDDRAKVFFLSLAMPTVCFARQASSGSETTRQAGEAIKTPLSFRATSVERGRNDGGVHSKHLLCKISFSRETSHETFSLFIIAPSSFKLMSMI